MDKHKTFDSQTIFAKLTDAVIIFDLAELEITYVNSAFESMTGHRTPELFSTPIVNLIEAKDVTTFVQQLSDFQPASKSSPFSIHIQKANGDYFAVSCSLSIDHESKQCYCIIRDISHTEVSIEKLKQIEAALQQKSIIAVTDARGVIQEVNQNFCSISGYSEKELVGKTHQIVNSGFHPPAFFKALWQTISSGHVWSGTIKNKRKNGSFYYVKSIITPLFDDNHSISGYLAIRHDVTKSVTDASLLNKTLKALNDTNAVGKVGGWELNVASGELTWTDETFRILEVEKKNGQSPMLPEGLKLFVPEHQPIIESAVQNAIEHGLPYNLKLKALTAKGNVLWVYTNGTPTYRDGEIVSVSGTIQDIQATVDAENKIEEEKQKSIQSSKLASLGELSASVAHEINNPLGIIATYTEAMLTRPGNNADNAKKLTVIEKSVDRIVHIVQKLKRFSRTNKDRVCKLLNVEDVVSSAESMVMPRLKGKQIRIERHMDVSSPILANEIEIEQVLINVLNNAIDAVEALSERWISISAVQESTQIYITITDSGAGIPFEYRDKLFDPFFTSKVEGKGTGIGLSIVKGLLKDNNASIWIDENATNTSFVIKFIAHEDS